MNTRLLVSSIAVVCALSSAFAQNPGALDQVDQQRLQRERAQAITGEDAPSLYDRESDDVGPQSVLRIKPRRTWVTAQVDAQYFYTDNMFNVNNEFDKTDTTVLVSTAEAAFAPTPFEIGYGTLGPRVGYRHQWFNYGLDGERQFPFPGAPTLGDLDFQASTIFSDVTWSDGNWDVQAGFDVLHILDMESQDLYREYIPHWRLQRSFALCDRTSITLGYEGDYRFTNNRLFPDDFTDFNDRWDHAVYATFNYWICSRALIQPYYRFKYTKFAENDFFPLTSEREDYLHSFGVSLYIIACKNFNMRLFAGYDVRYSSEDFVEYERLDTGGGINLNFRF